MSPENEKQESRLKESSSQKTKFYITTPVYYVNDKPHLGHAYTTIAADVLARWKRLKGFDVFLLTGTDEHGLKIEKAAQTANKPTQQFIDEVVQQFLAPWKVLNISYDDFIRTSEERHKKIVLKIFEKINKKGDIYKGEYEGWYCVPCETFWTDLQLKDGKCPECGREVDKLKEESYFFKLSKYQDKVLEHIEKTPDFIQPESRRNEIINFIKQGLHDLSISRTSFSWGIPVPDEPKHVFYVWFDALLNYVSALNYPYGKFKRYWPADVHLIGKEITRFHAVIWPAILMSAGIELPKNVFAHGWWTVEGEKMSKSKGNIVDPVEVVKMHGADALRYFLLREIPFGHDGDYSEHLLMQRINSDLADNLGNLVNRTLVLVEKNLNNKVPETTKEKNKLVETALETPKKVEAELEKLQFHNALAAIFALSDEANKYINETKPWEIRNKIKQADTLYNLLETLRFLGILLYPFMPETAGKILIQLGIKKKPSLEDLKWGLLEPGKKIKRGDVLFRKVRYTDIKFGGDDSGDKKENMA